MALINKLIVYFGGITVVTTVLSFLPIITLLVCLLMLKMSASKSGAISFLVALIICIFIFRPDLFGLSVMLSKGFGLAVFVIFIIWGAMFLYNLVNEVGALNVINKNISILIDDKYVQFLFLAWVFAPFLQGIAGFGVPVIVVTPILIAMGFDPVVSAAGVLLGHCWSISFGSMGSSIYAIDMVTKTAGKEIVPYMAIYGILAMLIMGMAVSFVYGGKKYLSKGLPYVIITSCVMGAVLYLLARLQMFSVIGLMTGISGLITLFALYKIKNRKNGGSVKLYSDKLSLVESLLPYILIVLFSITFFILGPKWAITLDFPGYTSLSGVEIAAEEGYVTFNLLKFPFSIILISSLLSMIVYRKRKCIDGEVFKKVISNTVKKCVPTSITLVFLLCMAQIMMDSGMISSIANLLVLIAASVYPAVSPFIGLLGAFITGSNTNSNVLFGNLQEVAATVLSLSPAVMCAVQSIGASVGCAIGPTTVSLGSTSAQIIGQESKIYKLTLLPVIVAALVLGIANMIILYIF